MDMWYWISNLSLMIGTFFFMEGVAWFTHKYIMHGILWIWHKDHHQRHKGFLEWNDMFAVCFSSVAIFLWVTGLPQMDWKFWMGVGITLYGIAYFFAHDVLVHQRLKVLAKPKSRYLRAIKKAHYVHHSKVEKHGAESFGFLFVRRKYWPES